MARRILARDAAEFAAAVLVEWVANCLTERAAEVLARGLGRMIFNRKHYPARARAHLRLAFPRWPEAKIDLCVRRCFENAALVPVESFRLLRRLKDPDEFKRRVALEADPAAWGAVSSGKGAILVTAHLGNWELAATMLTHQGISLMSVARPQENRFLYRRIQRWRRRLGQRVVDKQGALFTLARHLARGGNVALIVDQDARREGIFVPFFGRLCSTYDSAAALALRFGRPIIPAFFVRRDGGGFVAVLAPPVPIDGLPADKAEARRELTARMNGEIERFVRAHPDQWIWHYRRWKTRPLEKIPNPKSQIPNNFGNT